MTATGASGVWGDASFDADRIYRYRLTRRWDRARPTVVWIMLNPSTATAWSDDATIRRVIGFSRAWGFGMAEVVNLFGLCATDPRQLSTSPAPVGPGNDQALLDAVSSGAVVVVAWGNHGAIANPVTGTPRCYEVLALVGTSKAMLSLGETGLGQPRHPLYMPATTRPEVFAARCPIVPVAGARRR